MSQASVVVGHDGSVESDRAVIWAAKVAGRRGAPLVIVTATGWVTPPAELYGVVPSGAELVQEVADKGAELARNTVAGLDVTAVGVQEEVLNALLDPTLKPQLIVVGHRGQGGLGLGQVGSVAFAVVNQARCPVAVIREQIGELPSEELGSVVATDGSKHGQVALEQAAQWAAASHTPLKIVSSWRTPAFPSLVGSRAVAGTAPEASARAEAAAQEIVERAAAWATETYPDLKVETVTAPGRPAEVIVDQAKDASLVIVGARGRGELASMVLGSVSREVIEHATCPVYVVR